MKKLFFNLFIFIGLILIYKIILIILIVLTFRGDGNQCFYGKSTKKARIILVGSSNIEHNYNYTLLNEYFHEYNIIGCALSEPSGFYATINKLEKLKPTDQDIIVYCLPHSLYEVANLMPLKHRESKNLTVALLIDCFRNFPIEFIKIITDLNVKDIYKLLKENGFSKTSEEKNYFFQDIPTIQLDKKYKDCWVNDEDKFFIKSDGFDKEYLIRIQKYLTNKFDSKTLFRFSSIKENEFYFDKGRLFFLKTNFPFINSFESSVYKHEFWFNQWYHLNSCGRDLNTKKLIFELEGLS